MKKIPTMVTAGGGGGQKQAAAQKVDYVCTKCKKKQTRKVGDPPPAGVVGKSATPATPGANAGAAIAVDEADEAEPASAPPQQRRAGTIPSPDMASFAEFCGKTHGFDAKPQAAGRPCVWDARAQAFRGLFKACLRGARCDRLHMTEPTAAGQPWKPTATAAELKALGASMPTVHKEATGSDP